MTESISHSCFQSVMLITANCQSKRGFSSVRRLALKPPPPRQDTIYSASSTIIPAELQDALPELNRHDSTCGWITVLLSVRLSQHVSSSSSPSSSSPSSVISHTFTSPAGQDPETFRRLVSEDQNELEFNSKLW